MIIVKGFRVINPEVISDSPNNMAALIVKCPYHFFEASMQFSTGAQWFKCLSVGGLCLSKLTADEVLEALASGA